MTNEPSNEPQAQEAPPEETPPEMFALTYPDNTAWPELPPAGLPQGDEKQIRALFTALAGVHNELPNAGRKSEVKMGNSDRSSFKYADRAATLDAARPVLKKHGVALFLTSKWMRGDGQNKPTQKGQYPPKMQDSKDLLCVRVMVLHKDGGYIASEYGSYITRSAYASDKAEQAAASGLTYISRYAMVLALNIAQEDEVNSDNYHFEGEDVNYGGGYNQQGQGNYDPPPAARSSGAKYTRTPKPKTTSKTTMTKEDQEAVKILMADIEAVPTIAALEKLLDVQAGLVKKYSAGGDEKKEYLDDKVREARARINAPAEAEPPAEPPEPPAASEPADGEG